MRSHASVVRGGHKSQETRERELERLRRSPDSKPYDILSLESRNATNERLINHMNTQIDLLQTKNHELETRIDEYEQLLKVERRQELELDARNQNLRSELTEVDRMAKRLNDLKETTIKAADLELGEARTELERMRIELERQYDKVAALENDRKRLMEDGDVRRNELLSVKTDFSRLDELCKRLQSDKNKLAQRIAKLTANERELVLEIERLKLKGGAKVARARSPNRVDVYMRGVEQDRDYFKAECELLQQTIRELQSHGARSPSPFGAKSRTRSVSPSKRNGRNAEAEPTPDSGVETAELDRPKSRKFDELRQQVSHYESAVRALESELTYYKRQVEQQQAQLAASRRARSPVRPLSPPTKEKDDFEVHRLRQERAEAQSVVEKLERHLADLQANTKVLQQDRDKINDLYEESQKELKRLRQELLSHPKSPRVSLAAQAILRRVEAERDDLLAELRRTATDRDSFKERLRVATEAHLTERSRLEQRLEDVQNALRRVEHERDEKLSLLQATNSAMQSLEEQRKVSLRTQAELTEELKAAHSEGNQLRLLLDQAERALDEAKRRLVAKDNELEQCFAKLRLEDEHVRATEQSLSQVQADATHLRNQLVNAERRAEQLQQAVDVGREQIAKLDLENRSKESTIVELRTRVGAQEAQLSRSNDQIASRERDIKTLRKQFDAQLDEVSELKKARDSTLRENRHIQDDATTLARENQALQRELQDAIDERERFKQQVQDYILEVKRVEDLLASKEQERTDLLEQYRMLSLEADKYQTQSHQLESEASNYKLQLLTRDSDARKFRERLEQAESDLRDQSKLQQQYDMQMNTLNRSITELEDLLRQSEMEKEDLLKDLQAVRDLCARLEASRDQLQRQLTNKSIEHDQTETKMDALLAEMQSLRDQIAMDKESIRSLEGILQNSREKEYQTQANAQDRNVEVHNLRERGALNEAKLETMTREVSNLRARNLELEAEIEKLRRQLTGERLERERSARYTPIGTASAGGAASSYVRPSSTTAGIASLGTSNYVGAGAAAAHSHRSHSSLVSPSSFK